MRARRSMLAATSWRTCWSRPFAAQSQAKLEQRDAYIHFDRVRTRLNDNDGFGHVNNVMYYAFMDDAVNSHLLRNGIGMGFPRVVVQSSCRYIKPVSYPTCIDVGLRVSRIGNTSVSYNVGMFCEDEDCIAALGTYVHCYVDATGRPIPIHEDARKVLATLEAA